MYPFLDLSAGTGDKTVTFLGSHMDVVPANPETWEVNFTLFIVYWESYV